MATWPDSVVDPSLPLSLQVSLQDEGGNMREDLTLPKGTEEADRLAVQLREQLNDENFELVVTVIKVS